MSCAVPERRLRSDKAAPLSDGVYLMAAAAFQHLRREKPVTHQVLHYGKKSDTQLPESGDKTSQRQAFQLAFNTIKYQELLEYIMMDSSFLTSQHLPSESLPLAMVMLFDFQERKFTLRPTKDLTELSQEVRALEHSLHKWKIKLAASLARYRIKRNLQSVSLFLPDPVRAKQQRMKLLPCYAWVNTLKSSVEEVCAELQRDGLCEVKSVSEVAESTFCRDHLCPDTLVFSQSTISRLEQSDLTATHRLNIQERSVCVAVSVLRPLLYDCGDVMVAGCFSAMTAAHVAVAAAARCGRALVSAADHTAAQLTELHELLALMDVKNLRVVSEAFLALDEWDSAAQRLKVIVVLPRCSTSALSDPVSTIHSEHGDWDLLTHLCGSSVSQSKLQTLTSQQARLLAHSLTFPKVQTVVYCTRSIYPEENEQLVKRVLEKTHTHSKLLPFRVNGPIFPDDSLSGDAEDSKFFRLEASQFTNGCFVARLSRQADPTKVETVQDVLARAAAKGLLGGILPEQANAGTKSKNKKSSVPSATGGPELLIGLDGDAEAGPRLPQSDQDEDKDEEETEGNKGGKGKKKKKKGRKRKVKKNSKQSSSQLEPKTLKKKPAKKNAPTSKKSKGKARKIPRLTLSLISSAKASIPVSSVTQQTEPDRKPPPRPTAPKTPSKQRQSPDRGEGTAAQRVLTPADFVLPPISSSTSSSLSSSSLSRPPSSARSSRRALRTTASSSVTLPSLRKLGQ
ncbi:putative methyltransferase NSUN7 isoform X1 [Synchiropus splendidus]|uniref:putative methyltransferase NSUN7 isoform X1 n=3 Tax=Synchiropus splendidus TaxID=270530 RepID=UPI00237D529A|nr:putative methyltransferase NSUN7 isoform X1 [Synchiropus splendidus]